MPDFAERLGSLNIGVDQASVDMITSIKDATQNIAKMMGEAGMDNEKMLSSMKELRQVQMDLTMRMQTYKDLNVDVLNNTRALLDQYAGIGERQEKNARIERDITEQKKTQAEESKKISGYAGSMQSALNDPAGAAIRGLEAVPMPPWLKGLIAGGIVIAKEGLAAGAQAQDISRTGGELDALGGWTTARLYGQSRRFSGYDPLVALETFGRGYATREQYAAGAATLYGFGGGNLRGEGGAGLTDLMARATRAAYVSGGDIQEAAPGLAKLNRVFNMGSDELASAFEGIAYAAKESGEHSKTYRDFLMDAATSTHAYGASVQGVTQIVGDNYRLIREEKMGREEMIATIALGKRMGLGDAAVNDFIRRLGEQADKTGQKVSDLAPATLSLEKAFVSISHDSGRAFSDAAATTGKFAEALKKDISEGTLTKMVDYLVAGVGMSRRQMETFGRYFVDLGANVKISSDKIANWHEQMTVGTKTMFDDPKEAAWAAGKSLADTAKMFDHGTVTVADWTAIIKSQMDVLGDTGSGAVGKFTKLAAVVETTNVRMAELATWTEQSSKIVRQYGYDQTASTNLMVAFTQGIREGLVSFQDLQTVMKGPAGASEGMRGMVIQQLASTGGALGAAFSKTGVLGGVDVLLPDLMTYLGSGKEGDWTPALKKAFGTGPLAAGERQALQGQIGGAFQGIIRGVVGGPGGTDIDSADFLAAYKKLSAALFGTEITAVGKELSKLVNIQLGTVTPEALAGPGQPDEYKKRKELIDAYGNFPKAASTIHSAASTLWNAAVMQEKTATKQSNFLNTFLAQRAKKLYPNSVSADRGSAVVVDENKVPWLN